MACEPQNEGQKQAEVTPEGRTAGQCTEQSSAAGHRRQGTDSRTQPGPGQDGRKPTHLRCPFSMAGPEGTGVEAGNLRVSLNLVFIH